mgnify:CR=1 FL=1
MSLLTTQNLGRSFGPVDIFEGISLSIPHNARIAIVGSNGVGKTTLLRHLRAQKPAHEVWAVLVNEFGQSGLDGVLLDSVDQSIAIREVAGGCLCCSSLWRLFHILCKDLRAIGQASQQ